MFDEERAALLESTLAALAAVPWAIEEDATLPPIASPSLSSSTNRRLVVTDVDKDADTDADDEATEEGGTEDGRDDGDVDEGDAAAAADGWTDAEDRSLASASAVGRAYE
jgi:hypothetical protein